MIFFSRSLHKALVIMLLLFSAMGYALDEPTLPAGLFDSQSSKDAPPALPSGLGVGPADPNDHDDVPLLPSGLETSSSASTESDTPPDKEPWMDITGFWEVRSGYRLQNDKYQKDASLGETRLQLEMEKLWNGFAFNLTTDLYYDWVDENHSVDLEAGEGFLDLREASVAYSPFDFMDIKLGRQILTWGTGDLVFINDLFPKDWQSFLLGRDTEYLKAPSDALKASFFTDLANIDIVYTPRFDSDRHITGERLSYWNGSRIAGNDDIIRTDKPDDWFDDDEWAVRTSKNVGGYELAAYGYWGYWKSPGGFDTSTSKYTFPKLNVYGASVRGQVGRGIGNIEIGYYDSSDDDSGDDPFTNNSQMRYLVGYERDFPEIASDFTVGLQYYLEQMLDYGDYKQTLPAGSEVADEYRHLLTFRVTKLYWNQNLTCSLFTFYSPSDEDAYMRPNVHYKVNDNLAVEAGANIFWGDKPYTFFGQFEDNTNIYTAIRCSF
jgi:hypothetical protein